MRFAPLLAGCSLLLATPAAATPPDATTALATPLCTGDSSLIALVQVVTNQGTYYVTDARWKVLRFDARTGRVEHETLIGAVENTVNSEGTDDPPETSPVAPGAALADVVARWAPRDCSLRPAAWWGPSGSRLELTWQFVGETVVVGFGGRTRTLETTASADLRYLGDHWYGEPDPGGAPFENADDPRETRIAVQGVHAAGEQTVLTVEVAGEFAHRSAFVAVDGATFAAATSYLINATGLDQHQAGDYETAAAWFRLALRADPSNVTAQFNLACALSLGDLPDVAMRQLQSMEPTAELRGKATKDTDLDSLRGRADFKKWLRGLPKK